MAHDIFIFFRQGLTWQLRLTWAFRIPASSSQVLGLQASGICHQAQLCVCVCVLCIKHWSLQLLLKYSTTEPPCQPNTFDFKSSWKKKKRKFSFPFAFIISFLFWTVFHFTWNVSCRKYGGSALKVINLGREKFSSILSSLAIEYKSNL